MRTFRVGLATASALLTLALVSASPIAAQSNKNGNGNGNAGGNGNGQNGNAFGHDKKAEIPSETPELSSLVLFGTSAAGLAGYALMRVRAGRRHEEDEPTPSPQP